LATVLSGLEPAIAIALACIPLLRPLFKRQQSEHGSSQYYGAGRTSKSFSKKGGFSDSRSLDILDDNSSGVQLRPMKAEHNVQVSTSSDGRDEDVGTTRDPKAITIDTSWEVRSDKSRAV
jgi:hypothetical protein